MSSARGRAHAVIDVPQVPDPPTALIRENEDLFCEMLEAITIGTCMYCGCDADSSVESLAYVIWDEGDQRELYHDTCTHRDPQAEQAARRARNRPWEGSDIEYESWLHRQLSA